MTLWQQIIAAIVTLFTGTMLRTIFDYFRGKRRETAKDKRDDFQVAMDNERRNFQTIIDQKDTLIDQLHGRIDEESGLAQKRFEKMCKIEDMFAEMRKDNLDKAVRISELEMQLIKSCGIKGGGIRTLEQVEWDNESLTDDQKKGVDS